MEFLIHYFKHIRHEELIRYIMVKMLNDSLAEAFFGHITEMISGNYLTFLQMARLLASEAFHYLLIVLSSLTQQTTALVKMENLCYGCFSMQGTNPYLPQNI